MMSSVLQQDIRAGAGDGVRHPAGSKDANFSLVRR